MSPRSLVHAGEVSASRRTLPIFAKGFRPFFWLASLYAVLVMPLWLIALGGRLEIAGYFGGSFWHAHEMVFGFTLAVIAGFLLTAIENWTSRETARGVLLALLALVWMLGRVAVFLAGVLPHGLVALVDLAFIPLLALACARPIAAARAKRNYVFIPVLLALFAANATMHAGALGMGASLIQRGARIGVDLIILIILIMTARILPMFTRNATRRSDIQSRPRLDLASSVAMAVVLAGDVVGLSESLIAPVALATAALVVIRAWSWGGRHSLRDPLVWVLHAGHSWVAIGLVLRGLSLYVPQIGFTHALHALTAGAIAALTLGMMARVSLGHTGRMLAAPRGMNLAFIAVTLAAIVRVFGPLFGPKAYLHSMLTAGTLFTLAFAIFCVRYTPILFSPRVDGKPG